MTTTKEETIPTPALPAEHPEKYYILGYRVNGKYFQTLEFSHRGTLQEAIDLGREYCGLEKHSFVNVSLCFPELTRTVQQLKEDRNKKQHREPGVVY